MAYAVAFKASALKQLEKLPRKMAQRVLELAESLATDPRPSGCVKLAGPSGLWRLRVGDYRLVYAIEDTAKQVDVRVVAHRREVYRDI